MFTMGLLHVHVRSFDNKEKCYIRNTKQSLYDSYANEWADRILNVPKLRSYITYKGVYKAETCIFYKISKEPNDQ